ncbi:MAG: hypothetical protein J6B37_08715 [Clostridia bacterium]|nr:hypothetical protein [Clostridia bacterium]
MESFKAWILSICGATLVTSLCKVILSNSKIQKMTNVFLSIFVLLYTILPIKNINLSFNSFQNEIIDEDSYDLYYQEGYKTIVLESIKNICEKHEINVISIEMDSYIDDENNFVVDNLVVDIEDDSRINEAIDLIKNSLKYEVNVI